MGGAVCENSGENSEEDNISLTERDENILKLYLKDVSKTIQDCVDNRLSIIDCCIIVKKNYEYYTCTLKPRITNRNRWRLFTEYVSGAFTYNCFSLICMFIVIFIGIFPLIVQIHRKVTNKPSNDDIYIIPISQVLICILLFNPFFSALFEFKKFIKNSDVKELIEIQNTKRLTLETIETAFNALYEEIIIYLELNTVNTTTTTTTKEENPPVVQAVVQDTDGVRELLRTIILQNQVNEQSVPETPNGTKTEVAPTNTTPVDFRLDVLNVFLINFKNNNSTTVTDKMTNTFKYVESIRQFFLNQNRFMLKSFNHTAQIKHNETLDKLLYFLLARDTKEMKSTLRENVKTVNASPNVNYSSNDEIRQNADAILKKIEGFTYGSGTRRGYTTDYPIKYEKYFVTELNIILNSIFQYLDNQKDMGEDLIDQIFKLKVTLQRLKSLHLPEYGILKNYLHPSTVGGYFLETSTEIELLNFLQDNLDKNELITRLFNEELKTDVVVNVLHKYVENNLSSDRESSIFNDTVTFIKELSTKHLPNDFTSSNIRICELLYDTIISFTEGISDNPTVIKDYIKMRVKNMGEIHDKTFKLEIFVSNVNSIISTAFIDYDASKHSDDLFFDPISEIKSKHLYITYDHFRVVFMNIKQNTLKKYIENIRETNQILAHYLDNLVVPSSQNAQSDPDKYRNIIILFTSITFILVVSYIFKQVTGDSFTNRILGKASNNKNDVFLFNSARALCGWVVVIVTTITLDLNRYTLHEYNRFTSERNTEALRVYISTLLVHLEEYNIMLQTKIDNPEQTSGIVGERNKLKDIYTNLVSLLETYDKCNNLKTSYTTSTFPIESIAVSIFIIGVFSTIVYITLKGEVKSHYGGSPTHYGGGSPAGAIKPVSGTINSFIDKIMVKKKGDGNVSEMNLVFSMCLVTMYVSFHTLKSSVRMRNNLQSGTLYMKNNCL
jgi:hypothetical protein